MIETPICSLLGIKYPVLQGGMAAFSMEPISVTVASYVFPPFSIETASPTEILEKVCSVTPKSTWICPSEAMVQIGIPVLAKSWTSIVRDSTVPLMGAVMVVYSICRLYWFCAAS